MHGLTPSLAYRASEIDSFLDDARNEGELRLVPLRAAIRALATATQRPGLVDAEAKGSIGEMLAEKAERRGPAFESVMKPGGCARCCLLAPKVRFLTPGEADELDEASRSKCIPLSGSDRLAVDEASAQDPMVVVSVAAAQCGGGGRDAMMVATRRGESGVHLSVRSAGGVRKHVRSNELPTQLLDRLFRRTDEGPQAPLPLRPNELPIFLKSAFADFVRRRLRLHVLCTSVMPSPVCRPVSLDNVTLKGKRRDDPSKPGVVVACLHASSATCLCDSPRRRCEQVIIKAETCGETLKRQKNGCMTCCLHSTCLGRDGNAANRVENVCTENTRIRVSCASVFQADKRPPLRLSAAATKELALIIVTVLVFAQRTARCYTDGRLSDVASLLTVQKEMQTTFDVKRAESERAAKAQSETTLCERDAIAVRLLRAGGVFCRVVASGAKRGHPDLTDLPKALKSHRAALVETHAHLFPPAKHEKLI